MGFKTFVSETLTAGDMNDLVMKQTNIRCTAAAKPTGEEGMEVHVTDEDRAHIHNGSTWVRSAWWSAAGRTGATLPRSAQQTIPTATETTVSWDTETADTDGFITVPSGTVTIPAGLAGLYMLTVRTEWSAGVGGLGGYIAAKRNGTPWITQLPANTSAGTHSMVIPWAVGDTLTVGVLHTASGSLAMTGRLDFYRIGA